MSKDEARINREMLMLKKNQAPKIGAILSQSEPKKCTIVGSKSNIPDLNAEPYFNSEGEEKEEIVETSENHTSYKAQDAYYGLPKLMFDLEVEIFSRVSCLKYWKLNFLSKQFSQLLQSREIFRVRRERGLVQPYVCILSINDTRWMMLDKDFKNFQKLPKIPADFCLCGDKETTCAGTHLIVIGREEQQIVVWRYELEMHKWIKDSTMNTPRIMYGSASRGTDAFFAGGLKPCEKKTFEVVNVAEKYDANTKTWTLINGMHKRRYICSCCFLCGKFYVLGGRDENGKYLTCGESYDEMTDSWELIPDMFKGFIAPQYSPLLAVVNDNLYSLEAWSNQLRVYDINANVWKKLGIVPIKLSLNLGLGVAFKSVGDRLVVIGDSTAKTLNVVYTCRPSPNVEEVLWEESHFCDGVQEKYFIYSCCVMFA